MPNAGIQGTRSTNWNSADAGSNQIHNPIVTAKVAIATASASQRTSPLRRPSALPTSSSRTAPTSGTIQESVKSIVNSQLPIPNSQSFRLEVGSWRLGVEFSSPQVITEHDDDADEQRAGVGADRSGLQAAHQRRAGGDDRRRAV